jgi:hypothetical protein
MLGQQRQLATLGSNTVLRQREDELVEVFGRHAKRIHQSGLDGAGYFGDPGLVVTAFDNKDFDEWHGTTSFFTLTFSMQGFDGQRDALTTADAQRRLADRVPRRRV